MSNNVSSSILDCAIRSYIELSNYEFTIILPRGGIDKNIDCIDLVFRPENFVHFLGLHYLTDKDIKGSRNSKHLFHKFHRKIGPGFNNIEEFNAFLQFDYDIQKCDVQKRLNLIIDLFDYLVKTSEDNIYCRLRNSNKKASQNSRKIKFDFAIEFKHDNANYRRIFFFMAKDKYSTNPVAYNPVSIIEQEDDYLEGHIFPKLGIFETKMIMRKNSKVVEGTIIY